MLVTAATSQGIEAGSAEVDQTQLPSRGSIHGRNHPETRKGVTTIDQSQHTSRGSIHGRNNPETGKWGDRACAARFANPRTPHLNVG